MTKRSAPPQLDLFETTSPVMTVEPATRMKAVIQLQALLTEAMTGVDSGREAGDDQDHA